MLELITKTSAPQVLQEITGKWQPAAHRKWMADTLGMRGTGQQNLSVKYDLPQPFLKNLFSQTHSLQVLFNFSSPQQLRRQRFSPLLSSFSPWSMVFKVDCSPARVADPTDTFFKVDRTPARVADPTVTFLTMRARKWKDKCTLISEETSSRHWSPLQHFSFFPAFCMPYQKKHEQAKALMQNTWPNMVLRLFAFDEYAKRGYSHLWGGGGGAFALQALVCDQICIIAIHLPCCPRQPGLEVCNNTCCWYLLAFTLPTYLFFVDLAINACACPLRICCLPVKSLSNQIREPLTIHENLGANPILSRGGGGGGGLLCPHAQNRLTL